LDKKEIIILDAELISVIGHAAFQAQLGNGHRIVAFARKADRERAGQLQPGTRVKVRMSPFDMSKGGILFDSKDLKNESTEFCKKDM
jgi:translation initiation factor IF-1